MELPFYEDLDPRKPAYKALHKEHDRHVVERLIELRSKLDAQIPTRTLDQNLILGTWNIRDFGSTGFRTKEALIYISEVISRFDIVAIQEVKGDLRGLMELRKYLGEFWDFIASDVTTGKSGNNERLAFLFDTRKLSFTRVAGEIVIPPIQRTDDDGRKTYVPVAQPARSPHLLGFKSGWLDFALVNVHIYYGTPDPNNPTRVQEIDNICELLTKRSRDNHSISRNIILTGDFNIFNTKDDTYRALKKHGFRIPYEHQSRPTNSGKTRFFDQIAVLERSLEFKLNNAGIFDFLDVLFRDEDESY